MFPSTPSPEYAVHTAIPSLSIRRVSPPVVVASANPVPPELLVGLDDVEPLVERDLCTFIRGPLRLSCDVNVVAHGRSLAVLEQRPNAHERDGLHLYARSDDVTSLSCPGSTATSKVTMSRCGPR